MLGCRKSSTSGSADPGTTRHNPPRRDTAAPAEQSRPYRIASVALEGCRLPSDPGCASCCRQLDKHALTCRKASGVRASLRYQCDINQSTCAQRTPTCASCSALDELELRTVAPLLRSADGPIDAYKPEDLERCRDNSDSYCLRLRWTEASANCQPLVTDAAQSASAGVPVPVASSKAEDTADDQPVLPYAIRPNALVGCREFGTECEYCARRYDGGNARVVVDRSHPYSSPFLNHLRGKAADCAQCMLSDELALRQAAARIQQGCNCSEVVHVEGLVDACFAPASCHCACRRWAEASLRCPPLTVALASQK